MLRNALFTSMRTLSLGQRTAPVTRPFFVGLSMRYKSTLTEEERRIQAKKIRYLRQTTDIPPAPSRRTSAWMLYMQEQIPNAKKENPEAGGPQLVAIISKSWKELSDAEKKVYADKAARKAAEMQKEYERWYKSLSSEQILAYNRITSLKKKAGARISLLKDPNLPARPLSSYMRFCNDARKTLPKGLTVQQQAKELGRMWAELPQSKKEVYEAAATKEMQEYREKMAKLKPKTKTINWQSVLKPKKAVKKPKVKKPAKKATKKAAKKPAKKATKKATKKTTKKTKSASKKTKA